MNEPPHIVRRNCPVCRTPFYSTHAASYEPSRCQFCFATIPANREPRIEIRDYPKESTPMPNPNKCMRCDAPCELAMFYCESCLTQNVKTNKVGTASLPALPHDPVNRPKHYTSHPSGIECIQITEHMSFNLGNAVKYLWRADEKGTPITDLEKAVWYINREIEKRRLAADSVGQGNLGV